MGRKPRVDRTPEEKWQIAQEGMKSGNVSETCRRHGIAQTLYYRWKDEAEQGSLSEARENISRYLEEYNHDRPHRGVENRTPHEAYLAFAVLTKNETLNV